MPMQKGATLFSSWESFSKGSDWQRVPFAGGSELKVLHNQLWLLQTSRSALPEEGPLAQYDNGVVCVGDPFSGLLGNCSPQPVGY